MPGRGHPLSAQAAAAQQGSQPLHNQSYNRHTPVFRPKSSKKTHPLYTAAPVPHLKSAQPRQAKQKAGVGFAIRQPTASAAAAARPMSTSEAVRQLTGLPANTAAASKEGIHSGPGNAAEHVAAGQQRRAGSIAELIGDIQPVNHEDDIEDVEMQDQDQLHLQSPSRQDNTRCLLERVLEGTAQHVETSVPQAQPGTPVVRGAGVAAGHDYAVTPSMRLQRQFIASLQDTPAASSSQYTAGRSRATPGSLTARLNRVLQLEKAQQAQFESTGSLGRQSIDVTVIEHQVEGHIIKCRCCKGDDADQLHVIFNGKRCRDVNLSVGSHVTLHRPWTDVPLEGCAIHAILCQYVSART